MHLKQGGQKGEAMWEETNKPKTWQDFVGNAGAVQQCKDWIKNFQSQAPNTPRVLIINGPEGCGKSLAADLLLKKQGYKKYAFGVKEIKKHKGDKNSLDNFCNLYISDLSELGAASSRRQTHGIVLEDYDGLTKSDKKFNKTIVELVKKNPSRSTPLIVTTSEPNLAKQSTGGGLLRLALVVTFQRLLVKDLARIALRVANERNLYLDNDQAEIFAKNAHGDARQMLLAMEMFYVGKGNKGNKGNKGSMGNEGNEGNNEEERTKISSQQILDFTDSCCNPDDDDSAQKLCLAIEGGLSTTQSEDERILGMAIGDRGDKRTAQERRAAIRVILDNSQQFAPFLFQTYLKSLSCRADRPTIMTKALQNAADIADEMSLGDTIREATWNAESQYELAATVMLENPIKRIRAARSSDESAKNFAVDIRGYQSYYGSENTHLNQQKIIALMHQLNPAMPSDVADLGMIKELHAHVVDSATDAQIAQFIYPVHPDFLEAMSRLKTGQSALTLTKARQKRLIKCHEDIQEQNAPRVKILDEQQLTTKRAKKNVDANDPFALNWD